MYSEWQVMMTAIPFIVNISKSIEITGTPFSRDIHASNEPLPAILETSPLGYVLSHDTLYTNIRRETTDDR